MSRFASLSHNASVFLFPPVSYFDRRVSCWKISLYTTLWSVGQVYSMPVYGSWTQEPVGCPFKVSPSCLGVFSVFWLRTSLDHSSGKSRTLILGRTSDFLIPPTSEKTRLIHESWLSSLLMFCLFYVPWSQFWSIHTFNKCVGESLCCCIYISMTPGDIPKWKRSISSSQFVWPVKLCHFAYHSFITLANLWDEFCHVYELLRWVFRAVLSDRVTKSRSPLAPSLFHSLALWQTLRGAVQIVRFTVSF